MVSMKKEVQVSDFILKMEYYASGSFSECREGQLWGGIEVAGNSWLSATSFLSFFYLIVEKILEEKATCKFSYMHLQATEDVTLGAFWLQYMEQYARCWLHA
jgi:hypothetical protein